MTQGRDNQAGPTLTPLRLLAVLAVLVLVLICWPAAGIYYVVEPSERAVVTRFGRLLGTTDPSGQFHAAQVSPGIHCKWPWPIDRVYTPKTTDVKSIEVGFTFRGRKFDEPRRSDALTGDENILKIMMVVQYKIDILHVDRYLFGAEDPHWLVERAVESAINTRVASLPVDEVLTTAKDMIQQDAIRMAQAWLDAYGAGIDLQSGLLQTVSPPAPVLAAFTEVTDAKKDRDRIIDEAREYEGRILPEARAEADQRIQKAVGDYAKRVNLAQGEADRFLSVLAEYRQAKEVTRTRLYVEAMERILSSMKVVILDPQPGEAGSRITIVE